ncbi:MAG: 3-hydroxyacyl-CoA dehydrogenase NAD-binding domain-containing protein [Clostridia bacterium]
MHVFVLGAGRMGLDIAQAFGVSGNVVTVRDINDEIIGAARKRLAESLDARVQRGKLSLPEANALRESICFTTAMEDAANVELVLEAVVENAAVKREAFAKLEGICREDTIFATNTSSISITLIASATKRADRFIGMHFFNPATVMKLVEVIRGAHTSDATVQTIMHMAQSMGKTPVEVNESPGFVVNRLLVPMINEAVGLVATGVATPANIDTAMQLGCNHPMGPLALGDMIGLDVVLAIMDTLYDELHDDKYRAHTLLRKMVRAGTLGKKSGMGFYEYRS